MLSNSPAKVVHWGQCSPLCSVVQEVPGYTEPSSSVKLVHSGSSNNMIVALWNMMCLAVFLSDVKSDQSQACVMQLITLYWLFLLPLLAGLYDRY